MSDFWNPDRQSSSPEPKSPPSHPVPSPQRAPKRPFPWKWVLLAFILFIILLAIVPKPPPPTPQQVAAEKAKADVETLKASGEVLAPWIFSVDHVTLYCETRKIAGLRTTHPITVEVAGALYGVNGIGKGSAPDVAAVATDVDTQPLIDRGMKLCEDGEASVTLRRPRAGIDTPK